MSSPSSSAGPMRPCFGPTGMSPSLKSTITSRPAGERLHDLAEIGLSILDVMIGVTDEHEIHRGRDTRVVLRGQQRLDVAEPLLLRPLSQIAHHVGLHVDGQHLSLRHGPREAHREIAGARPEIGDAGRGRERERGHHGVGLSPGVPRRIVGAFGPLLGVVEMVGAGDRDCPGARREEEARRGAPARRAGSQPRRRGNEQARRKRAASSFRETARAARERGAGVKRHAGLHLRRKIRVR